MFSGYTAQPCFQPCFQPWGIVPTDGRRTPCRSPQQSSSVWLLAGRHGLRSFVQAKPKTLALRRAAVKRLSPLRSAPPSRHPPPAPTSKPEPDVGAEDTGLMEGARRMAEKSSSGRSEWDRSGEEVAERLELIADQWREDESRRPRGERGADLG